MTLKDELSELAFGRLPADLRLQAEDTMQAFLLTEAGIREIASQFRRAEEQGLSTSLPQLNAWIRAIVNVKAQQDAATAKLEAMVDACTTRGIDDDTCTVLKGIFTAFVEGIAEAQRDMQQVVVATAARHSATRGGT